MAEVSGAASFHAHITPEAAARHVQGAVLRVDPQDSTKLLQISSYVASGAARLVEGVVRAALLHRSSNLSRAAQVLLAIDPGLDVRTIILDGMQRTWWSDQEAVS